MRASYIAIIVGITMRSRTFGLYQRLKLSEARLLRAHPGDTALGVAITILPLSGDRDGSVRR